LRKLFFVSFFYFDNTLSRKLLRKFKLIGANL
jgi:hypothetical protein